MSVITLARTTTACLSCGKASRDAVCGTCANPRPVDVTTVREASWNAVNLLSIGAGLTGALAALGGFATPGTGFLSMVPVTFAVLPTPFHFTHRDTGGIRLSSIGLRTLDDDAEPCDRMSRESRHHGGRCVGIGWALAGQSLIPIGKELVCGPCAVSLGINDPAASAA